MITSSADLGARRDTGDTADEATEVAPQSQNAGPGIVCVFADTGQRYLSVEGLFET